MKKQVAKTEGNLLGIARQGVPRKKLVGEKITSQHSRKRPRGDAGVHISKSAFAYPANDQLLNQRHEPADKLIVKRVSQDVIFQCAVIIETQKDGVEGFRKSLRHKTECILYRNVPALGGIDHAGEPFVLEFVP